MIVAVAVILAVVTFGAAIALTTSAAAAIVGAARATDPAAVIEPLLRENDVMPGQVLLQTFLQILARLRVQPITPRPFRTFGALTITVP